MLILSTGAGFGVGYRPWGLSVVITPLYHFITLSTLRARNPDGRDRVFDDAGRLAEGRVLFDDNLGQSAQLDSQGHRLLNFLSASWHSAIDLELEGLATITFGLADETTARAAFDLPVPQTIRTEMVIALTPTFTIRPLFSWSEWSIMETQQAINTDNGEVVLAEPDFSDIYAFKTVWIGKLTHPSSCTSVLNLRRERLFGPSNPGWLNPIMLKASWVLGFS